MRKLPLLAVLSLCAVAAFLAGLAVPRPAHAQNWTDVTTSASVTVDYLCLFPDPTGTIIRAEVFAHGTKADGGWGRSGLASHSPLAGAALSDAQAALSRARTLWINQQQ